MKKIYNAPETKTIRLHTQPLMELSSLQVHSGTIESQSDVLVKENNSSSRYNVWDDDWSD